jgi:hypothetical protein
MNPRGLLPRAQYGGAVLEYTGSDVVIERVTCTKPLQKDLIVEVLTVGNVYPPQVIQYIGLGVTLGNVYPSQVIQTSATRSQQTTSTTIGYIVYQPGGHSGQPLPADVTLYFSLGAQ